MISCVIRFLKVFLYLQCPQADADFLFALQIKEDLDGGVDLPFGLSFFWPMLMNELFESLFAFPHVLLSPLKLLGMVL